MTLFISHTWIYVGICLVLVIVAYYIMGKQGQHFFYFDDGKKKFTMLQLEFPKNRIFDYTVFTGIGDLPAQEARDVRKNLRGQLYVDWFVFIPAAYTGVFLTAMHTASGTTGTLSLALTYLAWFQVICLLLDVTENFYFIAQIDAPKMPSRFGFFCFRLMELLKWVPSLGGFLLCIIILIIHRF